MHVCVHVCAPGTSGGIYQTLVSAATCLLLLFSLALRSCDIMVTHPCELGLGY